jgi:hypothetical protein
MSRRSTDGGEGQSSIIDAAASRTTTRISCDDDYDHHDDEMEDDYGYRHFDTASYYGLFKQTKSRRSEHAFHDEVLLRNSNAPTNSARARKRLQTQRASLFFFIRPPATQGDVITFFAPVTP